MLEQDHPGKLPFEDLLSTDTGFDDAGVVGSQHGEHIVDTCLG